MQKICSFISAIILSSVSLISHDAIAKNTSPPIIYENQGKLVRKKIREYVGKNPVYLAIAGCESTGDPDVIEHWNLDGKLVKNERSSARGAFQVLTDLHGKWASKLGLDIRKNIDDYMKFVKIILSTQGLKAWKSSKSCWGKYLST